MSEKLRGSEQLKMQCGSELQTLTREEIEQVAGGAGFSYYTVFPKGIPWPELLMQNQLDTSPIAQVGVMKQLGGFLSRVSGNEEDSVMGPTGNTRVVQIHPTRRCNLRCLHCYSSSSPDERGMLGKELLLGAVSDAARAGYNWASISGGEPLMYTHLVPLLAHARACGLRTAIATNGMLLDARRVDAIAEVVDLIAISVDGVPESHNAIRDSARAFDLMASRLQGLRERGLNIGFIFTLTQHNKKTKTKQKTAHACARQSSRGAAGLAHGGMSPRARDGVLRALSRDLRRSRRTRAAALRELVCRGLSLILV